MDTYRRRNDLGVKIRSNKSIFQNHYLLIMAIIAIFIISSSYTQAQGSIIGWSIQSSGVNEDINAVDSSNSTNAWAVGNKGVVLSTQDGENWTSSIITSADLIDIQIFKGNIFVAGSAGTMFRKSIDGDWFDISISTTADIFSISIISSDLVNINNTELFAAGQNGEIWNSIDGGLSWIKRTVNSPITIYSIDMFDNQTGLAVGENSVILGTTDGINWDVRDNPLTTEITLRSVQFLSKTRAFITGDNLTLLKSSTENNPNVGFEWQKIDIPIIEDQTINLYSIYANSPFKFWIVGGQGTVLLSKDGGASFTQQKINETAFETIFYDIVMEGNQFGWIVGNAGTILYTDTEGVATADIPRVRNFKDINVFLDFAVPILNDGFSGLIKILFFSMFFGFVLGVTVAIFKTVDFLPLNFIGTVYTDVIRNTPLLVQLFFVHFGLPQIGIKITFLGLQREFISGLIGLSMNSGAYQGEIIRSGILAIPKGQMEAGRSLGLSYIQTMKTVIMPQALRITIPPLGNELVNLTLNTSLLAVIGYFELTRGGNLIIATTFLNFNTWMLVLLYYFVITYALTNVLRYIERKTKIPGLGAD